MDKSILKEESSHGEIYGDLEKEFRTSLEKKDQQEKDCGDV